MVLVRGKVELLRLSDKVPSDRPSIKVECETGGPAAQTRVGAEIQGETAHYRVGEFYESFRRFWKM